MHIFPLYVFILLEFALFALATASLSAASHAQERLDGFNPLTTTRPLTARQAFRARRTARLAFFAMGVLSLIFVALFDLLVF